MSETHIPIFNPDIEFSEIAPIPPEYATAKHVVALLQQQGYEAYIIGGAVRDLLIGKTPKDFDVATNASPEQILATPGFLPTSLVDAANITRVHLPPLAGQSGRTEMEVMTFHREGETHGSRKEEGALGGGQLEEDIAHRDLTINALALDPINNQLIDYAGGLEDLRGGTIRFVGNPGDRINEDPVRMLRAVRFRNRFGFTYDQTTVAAITDHVTAGQLAQQPGDRLRKELTPLLTSPNRRQGLEDLDNLGILSHILPELEILKPGGERNPESPWGKELTLLDHLHGPQDTDGQPTLPSRRLAWAALLSQLHNPDQIRTILNRFNLPKKSRETGHDEQKDILWMVANQATLKQLPSMRLADQRRMLNHSAFADILELVRAATPQEESGQLAAVEAIWDHHRSLPPEIQKPSLKQDFGIDGAWLMKTFGLKPGKELGTIVKMLEERHLNDEFADAATAQAAAKTLVGQLSLSASNE